MAQSGECDVALEKPKAPADLDFALFFGRHGPAFSESSLLPPASAQVGVGWHLERWTAVRQKETRKFRMRGRSNDLSRHLE